MLMSRFSTQLICTGCTPSARSPERILKVRPVSPASTASASANTSNRLLFATNSSTSASSTSRPTAVNASRLISWSAASRLPSTRSASDCAAAGVSFSLHACGALLDPARQLAALDRPDLDDDAMLLDRFDPGGSSGRAELLADGDDHERVGIVALAKLGDRLGALVSRPRRREPDLDDLAHREKREVVRAGE